jgi:hypothetical protein
VSLASEADLFMDNTSDRIFSAVGGVCAWWSTLEETVHDFILHLAACLTPDFDKPEVRMVLHSALSNMDFRQLIATSKALASQALERPLYLRCETILNKIDNELRTERNRYVHDSWMAEGAKIERSKQGTVVSRPQSRSLDLRFETITPFETIEKVEAFNATLEAAYHELCMIDAETAAISMRLSRFQ